MNSIFQNFRDFLQAAFLNEATTTIEALHPNIKEGEVPPILLTWDEWYEKINSEDKSHPESAYSRKYDKNLIFLCPDKAECSIMRQKTIGKIQLKFIKITRPCEYAKWVDDVYVGTYTKEELEERGLEPYEHRIVCTHDGIEVGWAQDEWGAVLISVVEEYRGLGIGEELVKLYRGLYPYKPSGGLTSSGYKQVKKYFTWMVKEALSSGIYSDLIKRGEISKERVKEILDSVNLSGGFSKTNPNPLKDIYKGNNEPIYIIENNNIIIFDSMVKELNNYDTENIPENFIKDLIYCYIHIVDFNGFPQVWDCYGEEKYIREGIEILSFLNKEEGGLGDYHFRTFRGKTKEILESIWNDSKNYEIEVYEDDGHIAGVPLKVIKPLKDISQTINTLKRISRLWFKKYDKYEEIWTSITELAYGYSLTENKKSTMKHIKLFEEWSEKESNSTITVLNEALPQNILSDIALFDTDVKKTETDIQKELGSGNKVEVKKTDVEEIKDPNISKEIKASLGDDVKSVVIIDVKKANDSVPHTFIIPQKKDKPKLNPSGVINLPTLYIGDKDAIETNIGGLRSALNSMAKGNDFDINKFSAKVTVKHSL